MHDEVIKRRKTEGERTIRLVYENFKKYFISGDLIIGGSFYYKNIGCSVYTEFKDIDFIVDSKKANDKILYEISDFFNKKFVLYTNLITEIDNNLISTVSGEGFINFDILRNDFRDNLSSIEIFPGILTNRQSDKKLIEVYEQLEQQSKGDLKIKFNNIKEFYDGIKRNNSKA